MRANSGKGIPAISELSKFGSANVWWLHVDPRLYKADGRRQGHALRHNGTDASGRQADGAEVGIYSFWVDDVAVLPILLIIHYEWFNGLGSFNLPTFPKESSTSPGGKAQE